MSFEAFHLPADLPAETELREIGGERLEVARPTPELLRSLAHQLREARRTHLACRPLAELVELVDGVARRFLDREDPLRGEAERLLHRVGGHSPEMASLILDGMASGWRASALQRLLLREVEGGAVLDDFRPTPGGASLTRAFGPELTTHVFSGNVPGVAVTSLVRALLVRSASLGKTAAGEPILPVLFARALSEADAGIGGCLAVLHWEGGEGELEAVAFAEADAVVAYGGRAAMSSIAARVAPPTRFLAYGPHLSLGIVLREASGSAAELRAAALSVAAFDQQGCVSPHAFLVEEGGSRSARAWAAGLAEELERLRTELPRRRLSAAEAAAIHGARAEVEFGGADHLLLASAGDTSWTVTVEPPRPVSATCLNRTVRVHPVADGEAVATLLAPLGSDLQSVGVAGDAERVRRLASVLGELGATRVTSLSDQPMPPAQCPHEGRTALTDLLRWTDLEPG